MATKKEAEVATVKESAQLPAGIDMDDLLRDSGAGVDDMGMDDVAVPYLYILQTNSPQVNEDDDRYVDGARPGMFYNNVDNKVYDGRDKGITVIPCAYERKYVEWVPRDSGGGYVADHDIDSGILSECTPNEKGIPCLKSGHLIVETAYHYVYMLNPETGIWEEIIIPMKSTMLKKSRRWNKTLMATLIPGTTNRAPRWLYPYQLKTIKETKNDNTWSNFDIARLSDPVSAEQYRACKAFAELFASGMITRAKETDTGSVAGEPEGGNGGGGKSNGGSAIDHDDEMPF